MTAEQRGLAKGYRSGLEDAVAGQLQSLGIDPQYEAFRISYTPPVRDRTYTPDFVLPNGIVIETKGHFVSADRQKHKMIKDQYPNLDIRFVFANPNAKLASQKDSEFRAWIKKKYGITVISAPIKERYQPEFFQTLKTKPSQTTYGDWCQRYGFQYAAERIPVEWIKEPDCPRRLKALRDAGKKGKP